jgi:hypothetical protein
MQYQHCVTENGKRLRAALDAVDMLSTAFGISAADRVLTSWSSNPAMRAACSASRS